MAINFGERVAIVTGAGGGLGRAYALAFAARGARVVVMDVAGCDAVVDEIAAAGGAAMAVHASVSDAAAVLVAVERVMAAFGRIDILINNAGILRDKSFAKMSFEEFAAVMDVHVNGAFICTKAVWDVMRAQNYGRIVMTTSSSGLYGNFGQTNYGAAKMALVGMVNTLAIEGAKNDIRVNAIAPTAATRMVANLLPEEELAILTPESIAPGVLYLASEDAPTHAILCAGGGGFERAHITLTNGIWLDEAHRTPEAVGEAFATVSERAGEGVPENGEGQRAIELAKARKKSASAVALQSLVAFFICAMALTLSACGGGGASIGPNANGGSGGSSAGASPSPRASGATASPSHTPTPAPSSSSSSGTSAYGSPDQAIPFAAPTDADPFYAQPKPFPNVPAGTVLDSRSVTYEPAGEPAPNTAYEVKYASKDTNGRIIATVEVVVKPLNPIGSPEPLFVEDFAEDALGPQCAPSHGVTGSTADSNEMLEVGVPTAMLNAGWTVVYPDFEGPQSMYADGLGSGLATLDAIRAAEAFAPAGLSVKTPVALNGYSGGAEAVSWAASYQKSYAPELNIVGVASGGTPADLLNIVQNIDGTSATSVASNAAFFDIIYMSAVGINRAFPKFLTPILNAKGVAAAAAMETGCIGKNSDGSAGPTGHFSDYETVADPSTLPDVKAAYAADGLAQPGQTPITNMFVYSSITDELIPIAGVDQMVASWCSAGAHVNYLREDTGGDHVSAEVDSEQYVIAFFTQLYEGIAPTLPPTTTTCN